MHQAGRGQRLQALVEPGAQARQQAEGHVVGGQALGVTKDAAGDPEETHADNGDFQRAQFRMQRGAEIRKAEVPIRPTLLPTVSAPSKTDKATQPQEPRRKDKRRRGCGGLSIEDC